MDLDDLRSRLVGLMSFPVTPFGTDGEVDLGRFRAHVRMQLDTPARGVFAACGTGELFSLTLGEQQAVVEAAVQESGGVKPVIAGVAYGTALAIEMAQAAEAVGADAVLVLPPYLVKADQDGLYTHYAKIAASVKIGVIPYQRDNAVLSTETAVRLADIRNVIGLKDGVGDTDQLTRLRIALEGRLALMNGMPTAELTCLSFQACGVQSYSSAVLNFVPEVAVRFHEAYVAGDAVVMDRLIAGFFRPFVELRDERAGYAVSLIKAGINIRAASVGEVRPPLPAPHRAHQERLAEIIERGLALV